MFNLMEKATNFGLLALAALPFVSLGTAHAQTATVKVSDLDLSRPAHVAMYEGRVAQAANKVCTVRVDIRDVADKAVCERAIRDEAASQLSDRQQYAYRITKVASR